MSNQEIEQWKRFGAAEFERRMEVVQEAQILREALETSEPEHVLMVRVRRLEHTLGSLIVWIAQSANAPISRAEAERLLEMLKTTRPL